MWCSVPWREEGQQSVACLLMLQIEREVWYCDDCMAVKKAACVFQHGISDVHLEGVSNDMEKAQCLAWFTCARIRG